MPIKQYLVWVGGILLCLIFAFDALLPKAMPRPDYDFDRGALKIGAPDTGIAPDTGAVAVSDGSVQDHASEPPDGPKDAVHSTVGQAFAKLKPEAPRKHPGKRAVKQQSVAAGDRPVAQDPWSWQWHSDWSSNWGLRGTVAEVPPSNARPRALTGRAEPRNRGGPKGNFTLGAVGRNPNCWFC